MFIIRKKIAGIVVLDDLGITLTGAINTDFDFMHEDPTQVFRSASGGDLDLAITAVDVAVIDPRDNITELTVSDGLIVARNHNTPHFGIIGARINDLDDVNLSSLGPNDVIQNNGSGTFVNVSPTTLAAGINLGDLGDVDDLASHALNTIVVFRGDGTNYDTVNLATDVNVINAIATNFLKNTTDSFDSGTLTIASGATVNFPSGSILTIQDGATATVVTPTGGFTNSQSIINKEYADSLINGLDWKQSADVATTGDIGGTFNATGGTGGNGEFTSVDLTNIDGVSLIVGDRIVVKDQTTGSQNGIYVVTTAGASGVIERASDHNSASEVHANNSIFVERGTANADKGFVITTADPIIINTTTITWANFASITGASSNFGVVVGGDGGTATADSGGDTITFNGTGINITASDTPDSVTFALHVADLTAGIGPLLTTDEIAVNDGGTTLRFTFQDMLEDLDIPFGLSGTGIVVRTGSDTYASRSIVASTNEDLLGASVVNGNGVSGNPEIGVDILNLTNPNADLAATDEFIIHDKSEGTAGANRKITGQNVADGVQTILGLPTGLTVSSVPAVSGTQPIVTYTDSTRSKQLSVESSVFGFGSDKLGHLEFLELPGDAMDADSGYIMPLQGTVVMITAHCEDTGANSKAIHLFIDSTDNGSQGTLSGGVDAEFVNTTVSIDFAAGQKIRLRAVGASGNIQDTVCAVWCRWRS